MLLLERCLLLRTSENFHFFPFQKQFEKGYEQGSEREFGRYGEDKMGPARALCGGP
jgi:hypothetical protein